MDRRTGKTIGHTRQADELSLLFEISQVLDRTPDLRAVLGQVLEEMSRFKGIMRCNVTLLDRETGDIAIETAFGLTETQRRRGRYKFGEGITGKVAKTGKPEVIPRISDEPRFLDRTGARRGLSKEEISFVCVPIMMENEVLGTLSADILYDENSLLTEYVRVLSVIASMISRAVNLRLELQKESKRLEEENLRLRRELKNRFHPSNIIGRSKVMQVVFDQIARVRSSTATVLVRGDSGTGKELVAQAIHYNSLRAEKPFVKVNSAALPENLIESELFGHEKGAFTGATNRRIGRFEMADGGSLFLDEIGDLVPSMQVKILRFLQEKEFERIGGSETIRSDVRIIAATHKNLEDLVVAGLFREDLYYRLNVFPIYLPPLRERLTDIPLLVDHFIEKHSRRHHRDISRISTSAIDMIMSYHWPGNVRELENCIERAVLMSDDHVIHGHHLPPTLQTAEESGTAFKGNLSSALDKIEKEYILDALKSSRGNMARAARILGITERIIGLRIRKYGINPQRYHT